MIIEGVEEVTEEVVQDTIKGIVDTVQWLGWTSTPEASFGGWSNVFSKKGLERYLATFVGGAVGGGIFKAQDKWINPFVNSLFTAESNSKNKEDIYTISRLIIEGRLMITLKRLIKVENIYIMLQILQHQEMEKQLVQKRKARPMFQLNQQKQKLMELKHYQKLQLVTLIL